MSALLGIVVSVISAVVYLVSSLNVASPFYVYQPKTPKSLLR